MSTEELLRDRLSDAVDMVEPRRVTVEEITGLARRRRHRQQSVLGATGVVATAAIVGITATVLPGDHPRALPAPASTKTSHELLTVVQPVVEKVLASFHISPVTVTAVTNSLASYDPTVMVSAGPLTPNKVGGALAGKFLQPLQVTISQHVARIDPTQAVRPGSVPGAVAPTPAPGSGTWPGGIRYAAAKSSGNTAVQAELPDDITVRGDAGPIATGVSGRGLTFEPNPLAGVTEAVVEAIAQGLPPIPHLPPPPQLPWVVGPNDNALTALQTAAAKTTDVAATAKVLYFKAEVVDTRNQNDIEEIWLRRDGQPGAYYAARIQSGKPHGNYSGGTVWKGEIGTDDVVDWNGLKSIPTDVAGLQKLLYATYGETRPSPGSLFNSFQFLVQESPASPRLQASLAVLAGRVPGAVVTPHTTDPLGRSAVAIYLGGITRVRLLFSPSTGTFLASEEITKTGAVLQYRAVTQESSVRAARVRPDGTTPQPLKKK